MNRICTLELRQPLPESAVPLLFQTAPEPGDNRSPKLDLLSEQRC